MRLNLARALLCRSELLLLDEPTNHLDLDTVLWLESWLASYEGTLPHDLARPRVPRRRHHAHAAPRGRPAPRSTPATSPSSSASAPSAWRSRTALRGQQLRQIQHLQSFVDRFRAKASKARQAQARVKMIERIRLEAPAHADAEFSFEIPTPARLPEPLLALSDAAVGYGARTVLSASA
jgi:ATP-binding cassette subfamily F protein 3